MLTNLNTWTTGELTDQLLKNRNNIKVVEIENAQIVEILESRIKEIKGVMYNG
jgi:16S rRNA A1518/A1519 N6-dimethyltransferase RsmA/KsgA/DIM1 with predicted DNA glycosylase/AP lyase activity